MGMNVVVHGESTTTNLKDSAGNDTTIPAVERQKITNGAANVSNPSDYPGVFTPFEDDTAPTSAAQILSIPNARVLQIGLLDNDTDGTATVAATRFLYVSFNHASLADTGVPATRRAIPIGTKETFVFPAATPLTKFAYKIDVAPGAGAAVKICGGYIS